MFLGKKTVGRAQIYFTVISFLVLESCAVCTNEVAALPDWSTNIVIDRLERCIADKAGEMKRFVMGGMEGGVRWLDYLCYFRRGQRCQKLMKSWICLPSLFHWQQFRKLILKNNLSPCLLVFPQKLIFLNEQLQIYLFVNEISNAQNREGKNGGKAVIVLVLNDVQLTVSFSLKC